MIRKAILSLVIFLASAAAFAQKNIQLADTLKPLSLATTHAHLYILAIESKHYATCYLQVFDKENKCVGTAKVNKAYTQLEVVCGQHVFLFSKDSIFTIRFEHEKISLLKRVAKKDFKTPQCSVYGERVLLSEQAEFMGLRTNYVAFTLPRDTMEVNEILAIEDTIECKRLRSKLTPKFIAGTQSREAKDWSKCIRATEKEIGERHDFYIEQYCGKCNLYQGPRIRKMNTYVRSYGKSFSIYDFSNGNIVQLKNDLSVGKVISFQNKKEFRKLRLDDLYSVSVDLGTEDFYGIYNKGKNFEFTRYNPSDGKIVAKKKMTTDGSVAVLRVFNGWVYYILSNGEGTNMSLVSVDFNSLGN